MKKIELAKRRIELHKVISDWLDAQDDEYWKGEIDDQMTDAAFSVYVAAMDIQAYAEEMDAEFDAEEEAD